MKLLNLLLAVVLAGVLAGHLVVEPPADQPNFDYLPEMVHSVAAESFDASPVLADGRVLQPPPPGAVARHESLVRFEASAAGAQRAAEELVAPEAAPEDLARGAVVYANFCTPCHSADGTGPGPIVARGYPAPPSLAADRALALADGHLFHIVSYGQVNMPGYAGQIEEADRWRVVAHIRHLQGRAR